MFLHRLVALFHLERDLVTSVVYEGHLAGTEIWCTLRWWKLISMARRERKTSPILQFQKTMKRYFAWRKNRHATELPSYWGHISKYWRKSLIPNYQATEHTFQRTEQRDHCDTFFSLLRFQRSHASPPWWRSFSIISFWRHRAEQMTSDSKVVRRNIFCKW